MAEVPSEESMLVPLAFYDTGSTERARSFLEQQEDIALLKEPLQVFEKLLADKGVLERFKDQDPLLQYNLPLAQITGASIQHRIALGENAPDKVRRILQDPHEGQRTGHLCYTSNGFSLPAATPLFGRSKSNHELDFLLQTSGQAVPIEAKFGTNVQSKKLHPLPQKES